MIVIFHIKNRVIFILTSVIFLFTLNIQGSELISIEKNKYCISEKLEIKSNFIDTLNYSLYWEYALVDNQWKNISILNATKIIRNDSLYLFNFSDSITLKIRCRYNQKVLNLDSISNEINLSILPPIQKPVISRINLGICYNTAPSLLSVITPATGGDGNFTYQWQQSTNNINFSDIQDATDLTYQAPPLIQNTYFRVVAKATFGCGIVISESSEVNIYNEFKPGKLNGDNQDICYNTKPGLIDYSILPTGGGNVYSYQWQVSTDDVNFVNIPEEKSKTYQPGILTSSVYYRLQVTSATDCGIVYTPSVKMNVLPKIVAPQITTISQPVCYNTAPPLLSVTVNATGGDEIFSYQWQRSTDNITFENINGEILKYYQPYALTQTTYYRVIALPRLGCGSVYSASTKVEVYAPLTVDNLSNQTICYNTQPALLTAVPHGGGDSYTYQWQESTNGNVFTDISAATDFNYQHGSLNADKYFRVLVKPTKGCSSVYSNSMKVTVYGELKSGSIGYAQTICYNTVPALLEQATLPTGGNGTYSYQWQVSTDNITFTNINGETTLQYQAANLTNSQFYRLQVTTGSGCGFVYTPSIKITVLPNKVAPQISTISQPICYNIAPSLLSVTTQATGSDGNFTYQWQESTNNVSFTDIQGQTALTYQAPALSQATYYRVVATATYGCGAIASTSTKVDVYAPLTVNNITNQTICYNTQPNNFTITAQGGGNSYTYQWQVSDNGSDFTDISGEKNPSYQPGLLTISKYYRVLVVSSKGCSSVYSNVAKVTVYSEFIAGKINIGILKTDTICYNTTPKQLTISQEATGGNGTFTYQWQYSINGTVWQNENGASQTSYSPGNLTASRYYRLQFNTSCGVLYSDIVEVYVNPLPTPKILSGNFSVCSNQKDNIYTIENQQTNILYDWSVSNGEITPNYPNNQKSISVDWGKQSGIGTITLKQTNTITGCVRDSNYVVNITTNISPDKTIIARKASSNILYCQEATSNIEYQWGYINKSNGQAVYIQDSNQRYVLLSHTFDSNLYDYFVETSFKYPTQSCTTRSLLNLSVQNKIKDEKIKFDIYPNPVTDKLFVTVEKPVSDNVKIELSVIDFFGRVLWENKYDAEAYQQPLQIPIQLENGIYLLQLRSEVEVLTHKFIVK